ncbi:hypothetical protein A1O1_05849 [Capronia coronata CBS 617.96]|uniref:Bacteriophage T5 Orf172 DNA-binding domain-containing protein n=1 Tax=Capronia coronata CBS 617.96 TaxID=1182541 RepID=W9Y787_9EURO|nr:uncharacterized protein A1O1_05849 [Capronia coronata CBS 617.96]EXJ85485.1 hypothetical protein A1O1_05849 [Capronia coronata CBS 617.96]
MASPRKRQYLTPKSRLTASYSARAFKRTPPSTPDGVLHKGYDTSCPTTPGLTWDESPPATEDPPTPNYHSDTDDGGVFLPGSPLATRTKGTTVPQGPIRAIPDTSLHELGDNDHDDDEKKPHPGLKRGQLYPPERKGYGPRDASDGTAQGGHSPNAASTLGSSVDSKEPRSWCDNPSKLSMLTTRLQTEEFFTTTVNGRQSNPALRSTGQYYAASSTYTATATTSSDANTVKAEDLTFWSSLEPVAGPTREANTPISALNPVKQAISLTTVWGLPTMLSKILPIDTVDRLRADPSKCVATNKTNGERCKNKNAGGLTGIQASNLLGGISSPKRPFDHSAVAQRISTLVGQVTCRHTHQKSAQTLLKELSASWWEIDEVKAIDAHEARGAASMATSMIQFWVEALMSPLSKEMKEMSQEDRDSVHQILASSVNVFDAVHSQRFSLPGQTTRAATTISVSSNADHSTPGGHATVSVVEHHAKVHATSKLSDHLNHSFIKYEGSMKTRNMSAAELIRQTLVKPLTPTDMDRSGYIYMFWHPGNFGYVKIGRAKDVASRLREWRSQCKYNLERHLPQEQGLELRVRHLHRIESLIHAELKDYRVYEPYCNACKKQHVEWFKVAERYAIKVILKWLSSADSLYSGRRFAISQAQLEQLCKVTEEDDLKPTLPQRKVKDPKAGSKPGQQRRSPRRSSPS